MMRETRTPNDGSGNETSSAPDRLGIARRLAAIAQNGLTYNDNPYDVERYEEIRRIAAEMMAEAADAPIKKILTLLEREEGYATPKVDVRGVVFDGEAVLLVREASDGGWTLPGGWADPGASARENVEREVREEAGLEVRATRLLAVYDREKHDHAPAFPFHIYKMFILCERVGGELKPSHETSRVGFFGAGELPELSRTRLTRGQLERMFELRDRPDAPPDFD